MLVEGHYPEEVGRPRAQSLNIDLLQVALGGVKDPLAVGVLLFVKDGVPQNGLFASLWRRPS